MVSSSGGEMKRIFITIYPSAQSSFSTLNGLTEKVTGAASGHSRVKKDWNGFWAAMMLDASFFQVKGHLWNRSS